MEIKPLTPEEEGVMLQQIWNELRYIRTKLDTHVDQNDKDFKEMKDDVSSVKNELSGHKVKLGVMFSGIGIAMAALATWVVKLVGNGNG